MMVVSQLKSIIINTYNSLLLLLPVKLANRWLWVHRDIDWSISIYEGQDFLALKPTTVVPNPVISRGDVSDIVTAFVADPFMVRDRDDWLMFFEIFNHKRKKGELAFAKSKDGYNWNYQHLILSEDFHLSYPYVFESESTWYMIPETCEANSVRLYRAKNFPHTWEFVTEILVGKRFVDASILAHDGMWWLFVGVEPDDGACNSLELYYSDRLDRNWVEHPMSPIVTDNLQISRPAGRVRKIGDRSIRFTQDCSIRYGYNVTAIQIESLTKDEYIERKIHPNGAYLFELGTLPSNRVGMHHIDFMQSNDTSYIACVDSR
jgi:hypothetical protein